MNNMRATCVTLLCIGLFSTGGLSRGRGRHYNVNSPMSDPTGTDRIDWVAAGKAELEAALNGCINVGRAKNVILFVGDGMGISTQTAARWLQAQRDNASIHDTELAWDRFPHAALTKTYCVDAKTPDSAATATAFLSGEKARKGTVGVNQHVVNTQCDTMHGENKLESILHKSHTAGKWTGVISTTRATHATPAATYASTPDRFWEADSDIPEGQKKCRDIAAQLIEDNDFIRVFLSGGRKYFMPDTETDPEHPEQKGLRKDGRNLMKEWIAQKKKTVPEGKFHFVMNDTDFKAVDVNTAEYLFGLFEANYMQYEADRQDPEYEKWGEPSLTEMTEKAINILQKSEQGYFLMVEGGRIDHAHHKGNAYRALDDTLALSRAVQRAVELTDDNTLMVVTADHSHTFTIGGYPDINHDIFDITNDVTGGGIEDVKLAEDGLPVTTLAYANGPGYGYHFGDHNETTKRRNLTEDSLSGKTVQKDYLQPAGVPFEKETHGGEDVTVYAKGPMAYLFQGTHEQTYIAYVLMYASCVGDNKEHCENPRPIPGPCFGTGVNGVRGQRTSIWATTFISGFVLFVLRLA